MNSCNSNQYANVTVAALNVTMGSVMKSGFSVFFDLSNKNRYVAGSRLPQIK